MVKWAADLHLILKLIYFIACILAYLHTRPTPPHGKTTPRDWGTIGSSDWLLKRRLGGKKLPDPGDAERKPNMSYPLKSLIHSFFSSTLSANPTLSYHSTHTETHKSREQMKSHRHQRARSVEETHWKQARVQREDGWLKRSCLPCFPHILISHYADILGSGGPETLKTCCSTFASHSGRLNDLTHSLTFSTAAG